MRSMYEQIWGSPSRSAQRPLARRGSAAFSISERRSHFPSGAQQGKDRRRADPSVIPKMWDWDDTELMVGLLISFVIMTALIVLLIGCGSRLSSGAKIPCYLCENMVVYGTWDDHKKDCLRVYERHIEALPKLKVSTLDWDTA